MMSQSQAAEPPAKKRRVAVACKRCNQQRVRCDAAVNGMPCTNCRRAKNMDCQFIESKRARGETGRFISRQTPQRTLATAAAATAGNTSTSPEAVSSTTADLPEYSVDLAELCDDEKEETSNPNSRQESRTHPASHHSFPQPQRPVFPNKPPSSSSTQTWGESWYLSFVLNTTNSEHHRLHQPIDADGEAGGQTRPRRRQETSHQPRQGSAPLDLPDLPSPEAVSSLVHEYFTVFHPFCPILDRPTVLESLAAGTISPVLLRCILFVASIHCDARILHRMGHASRVEAEDELFGKAKAAFDSDREADKLTMLHCAYLLHYWSGRPATFKDSLWWLAGAIRNAQSMGMHRSTKRSRIAPARQQLMRRTWWLLYIRDRQISISLGTPLQINDNDCDVEALEAGDCAHDGADTQAYVAAQARLSVAVSGVLAAHFAPARNISNSNNNNSNNENRQGAAAAAADAAFAAVEAAFKDWRARLPARMEYGPANRRQLVLILQMTAAYYTILVFRMLQSRYAGPGLGLAAHCTSVTLRASETITRLMEDVVMDLETRCLPMICVSAVFAAMTVQFVQSRKPATDRAQRELLLQKLRSNLLGLRELEQSHMLARWVRQLFLGVRDQGGDTTGGTVGGTHQSTEGHSEMEGSGSASNVNSSTHGTSGTLSGAGSTGTAPHLHASNTAMPLAPKPVVVVPTPPSAPASSMHHSPNHDDFPALPDLNFDFSEYPALFRYQTTQVFADDLGASGFEGWQELDFMNFAELPEDGGFG